MCSKIRVKNYEAQAFICLGQNLLIKKIKCSLTLPQHMHTKHFTLVNIKLAEHFYQGALKLDGFAHKGEVALNQSLRKKNLRKFCFLKGLS
jgi:hypothetical protein